MENGSRRRRCLITTALECSRRGATTIHDLADELLELVFLRVSSHRCLVCAAAACRPWRRVIAADGFLRRFRSVHALLELGHFYAGERTAFVPALSQPGKAVAGGGVSSRVCLDFLVRNYGGINDLFLSDCRAGLLAFIHRDSSVVVCDPWIKQYRVLVPPSMLRTQFCLGAVLLDADESGSVKVLWMSGGYHDDEQNFTVTAHVSATDEHWLLLASTVVKNQFVILALMLGVLGPNVSKVCVGRVGGSLFWSIETSYVFQVNETTGAFSSFYMPPGPAKIDLNNLGHERRKLRVVGRDGRAAHVVRIVDEELQVLQLVDGGGMCVEEKRVNLSELCNTKAGMDRSWHFLELSENVAPGCVVLSPGEKCTWMFFVDVESLEVERVKRRNWHDRPLFPYEQPWVPTIKACL